MGPSKSITPSQESEKIWDLDKALEFIEGAPLIHKKDSKMKKKAPGTIRIPTGCPDKEVPGLDLSSKVLKAETMKEQEEEEEEQQQQKQQEEEQEEEVEDEKNWIKQKEKKIRGTRQVRSSRAARNTQVGELEMRSGSNSDVFDEDNEVAGVRVIFH